MSHFLADHQRVRVRPCNQDRVLRAPVSLLPSEFAYCQRPAPRALLWQRLVVLWRRGLLVAQWIIVVLLYHLLILNNNRASRAAECAHYFFQQCVARLAVL